MHVYLIGSSQSEPHINHTRKLPVLEYVCMYVRMYVAMGRAHAHHAWAHRAFTQISTVKIVSVDCMLT